MFLPCMRQVRDDQNKGEAVIRRAKARFVNVNLADNGYRELRELEADSET